MSKIKMNIVGGAPATKPKLNRSGKPYMTLEEIVEHNTPLVRELKKRDKYWNCLRVPVVTVVEQIQIKVDRLGHQNMIGWKYKRSKLSTDIIIILPYNKKFGMTAVYHESEYEYL